jgi:hypothetical protein
MRLVKTEKDIGEWSDRTKFTLSLQTSLELPSPSLSIFDAFINSISLARWWIAKNTASLTCANFQIDSMVQSVIATAGETKKREILERYFFSENKIRSKEENRNMRRKQRRRIRK